MLYLFVRVYMVKVNIALVGEQYELCLIIKW